MTLEFHLKCLSTYSLLVGLKTHQVHPVELWRPKGDNEGSYKAKSRKVLSWHVNALPGFQFPQLPVIHYLLWRKAAGTAS